MIDKFITVAIILKTIDDISDISINFGKVVILYEKYNKYLIKRPPTDVGKFVI